MEPTSLLVTPVAPKGCLQSVLSRCKPHSMLNTVHLLFAQTSFWQPSDIYDDGPHSTHGAAKALAVSGQHSQAGSCDPLLASIQTQVSFPLLVNTMRRSSSGGPCGWPHPCLLVGYMVWWSEFHLVWGLRYLLRAPHPPPSKPFTASFSQGLILVSCLQDSGLLAGWRGGVVK